MPITAAFVVTSASGRVSRRRIAPRIPGWDLREAKQAAGSPRVKSSERNFREHGLGARYHVIVKLILPDPAGKAPNLSCSQE
jgi:hypothetical protein